VTVGELKKFIEDNKVPDDVHLWLEIDNFSEGAPMHMSSDVWLVTYEPAKDEKSRPILRIDG
jgi:hypothetical protein